MSYFVNTLSIQRWAETFDARVMLPHVIRQLVWATLDRKNVLRNHFPAYESGARPGFDGEVNCSVGNAWIPEGNSVWELSVDGKKASKARGDFNKRTENTPLETRLKSTYVCVSARKWRDKKSWERNQQASGQWLAVKVLDADDLEHWMEVAPSVATWFALKNGTRPADVDGIDCRWDAITRSTRRPLTPQVFLVSREGTKSRLYDWLTGDASQLVIESRSPSEVIDFFCASLQAMSETERLQFATRSIIVESPAAWKILRDNSFPTILIVDPGVQLSAEDIGRAVTRGHHVLLSAEPRSLKTDNTSLLERASECQLSEALESCGFSPIEAEQHARASGGSLAILKRMLGCVRVRQPMTWGELASQRSIVAALLLGGWDSSNEADRCAIEAIAGERYEELASDFQRLATCRDPLLFHAARNWRLLSKDEAWFALGSRITPSNLETFCALAIEILADDDPTIAQSQEERLLATINGHVPRYSKTIKTHVAQTVAFLGAFGTELEVSEHIRIDAAVAGIVRDTLSPDATWTRWASIGSRLALLAEASPTSFLRAVRQDLVRSDSELVKLFHDDGDLFLGSCHHAGLLWALETLAWSKQFLPDVAQVLLQLASGAPLGRWTNRPDTTMYAIFCHWMPHTMASVDERIELLNRLVSDQRETDWELLLKLLPDPMGSIVSLTHRPMWRNWANSWTRGTTQGDSNKFADAVGRRLIQFAGFNAARWSCIFENLSRFPRAVHDDLISGVGVLADSQLSDPDRRLVSEKLSEQLNRHRYFHDASWALPIGVLDKLESYLPNLKPTSVVLENSWLFAPWPRRFYERHHGSHGEHAVELELERSQALRNIIDARGFDGVVELVGHAEAPAVVGAVLANVSTDRYLSRVIPHTPDTTVLGGKYRDFADGFIRTRFFADGWTWISDAVDKCRTDDDRAWLFVALPFDDKTWSRPELQNPAVRSLYWQQCRVWNPNLSGESLRLAVDSLVANFRPGDAINVLETAMHGDTSIATEYLLRPLESLIELGEELAAQQLKFTDGHTIGNIIGELQNRSEVDIRRLARVEWNFLELMDVHHGRIPKTIHRHLGENANFFVELLTHIYRSSEDTEEDSAEVDESRLSLASQASGLLDNWRQLPGTKVDGTIDGRILQSWCEKARVLAKEKGRLDVCDTHLGELFVHSPADSDGRRPCLAVRQVIESIATKSFRSGLICGIKNGRGCVWRGKGGNQERELAAEYRKRADTNRFDAPFLAEVLDSVASAYEQEAHFWDERDRWES